MPHDPGVLHFVTPRLPIQEDVAYPLPFFRSGEELRSEYVPRGVNTQRAMHGVSNEVGSRVGNHKAGFVKDEHVPRPIDALLRAVVRDCRVAAFLVVAG